MGEHTSDAARDPALPPVLWVVGPDFAASRSHPTTVTVERLLSGRPTAARVRPGFGISPQQWQDLATSIAHSPRAALLHLEGAPEAGVDAARVLKHDPRNVLITDPLRADGRDHQTSTGTMAFDAGLAVPDGTEMILDHTIGQRHVPGMLIIEAMIQLVTAAVPRCLPAAGADDWIGVMHGCSFSFSHFTFPITARLHAALRVTGGASTDRVPMTAEVTLCQAHRETAVGLFALNAFSSARISEIERSQEAGALDRAARVEGATPCPGPARQPTTASERTASP
jgi:hypothetical protein